MGHSQTVTLGTREVVMLRAFKQTSPAEYQLQGVSQGFCHRGITKNISFLRIAINVEVQSFIYYMYISILSRQNGTRRDVNSVIFIGLLFIWFFFYSTLIHKLYRIIVIFN